MQVDERQWYEIEIDHGKPVAVWTNLQCAAYVEGADEIYSETTAEAGMGAVSFGMDPYGAMATVPHPASDPIYVACKRRLRDDRLLLRIELCERDREDRIDPVSAVFRELPSTDNHDDIPF